MARIFPRRFLGKILDRITLPLSQHIVKHGKDHPLLKQHVLLNLGRAYFKREEILRKYNWTSTTDTIDDVRAMELGTQMILDFLVIALLAASLYAEISKVIEARGEKHLQNKDLKIEDLACQREELMNRIKKQSEEIRLLKERMAKYTQEADFSPAATLSTTKCVTDEKSE